MAPWTNWLLPILLGCQGIPHSIPQGGSEAWSKALAGYPKKAAKSEQSKRKYENLTKQQIRNWWFSHRAVIKGCTAVMFDPFQLHFSPWCCNSCGVAEKIGKSLDSWRNQKIWGTWTKAQLKKNWKSQKYGRRVLLVAVRPWPLKGFLQALKQF